MNGKLKKVFLVFLILLVGTGCGNQTDEKEAKAAKQKAIKQEERQITLLKNCVDAYESGSEETSYQIDKKYKKVDALLKLDYLQYKEKEKSVQDIYYEITMKGLQSDASFLANAPDFTNLRSQATTLIAMVDDAHISFQDYASIEAATKRAQDAGLNKKSQAIYLKVYNYDKKLESRQTEMFELIDGYRSTIQHELDKMVFLSDHRNEWVNENNVITFYSDAAYDAYQVILNQ